MDAAQCRQRLRSCAIVCFRAEKNRHFRHSSGLKFYLCRTALTLHSYKTLILYFVSTQRACPIFVSGSRSTDIFQLWHYTYKLQIIWSPITLTLIGRHLCWTWPIFFSSISLSPVLFSSYLCFTSCLWYCRVIPCIPYRLNWICFVKSSCHNIWLFPLQVNLNHAECYALLNCIFLSILSDVCFICSNWVILLFSCLCFPLYEPFHDFQSWPVFIYFVALIS